MLIVGIILCIICIIIIYLNFRYENKKMEARIEHEEKIFKIQWRHLSNMNESRVKKKLSGNCGCENIMSCNFKDGCWFLKDKKNQPIEWKNYLV